MRNIMALIFISIFISVIFYISPNTPHQRLIDIAYRFNKNIKNSEFAKLSNILYYNKNNNKELNKEINLKINTQFLENIINNSNFIGNVHFILGKIASQTIREKYAIEPTKVKVIANSNGYIEFYKEHNKPIKILKIWINIENILDSSNKNPLENFFIGYENGKIILLKGKTLKILNLLKERKVELKKDLIKTKIPQKEIKETKIPLKERKKSKKEVIKTKIFIENDNISSKNKKISLNKDNILKKEEKNVPKNIIEAKIYQQKAKKKIILKEKEIKEREIVLKIEYKIPPEYSPFDYKAIFIDSQNKSFEIKDKGKLKIDEYNYKIIAKGYLLFKGKINLTYQKFPYILKVFLVPTPRQILFDFYSCKNKKEKIIPDLVKLEDKEINSGDFIIPGKYKLLAKKKGYKDIEEKIYIKANDKPYILKKCFKEKEINVKFIFYDKETKQTITPDNFIIDNIKIKKNIVPLSKGYHIIKVEKKGYIPLEKDIEIEEITNKIIINLEKFKKVLLKIVISFDKIPENINKKEIIILENLKNNKIIKLQGKREIEISPGRYKIKITRDGYIPYEDEFDIPSEETEVQKLIELKSKPRKIILNIKDKEGNKIIPDKILLNEKEIKNNKIKPGFYTIKILKKGYKSINENIFICASDKPFILEKTLEPLSRIIKLELFDKKDKHRITPDKIVIDKKERELNNISLIPGKHFLEVYAKDYKPLKININIPIGEGIYSLSFELEKNKSE